VPVSDGGKALLDVTELSRIGSNCFLGNDDPQSLFSAMERCKTARCAIHTMGDLATKLALCA
jgi:hypothetical protein